MRLFAAILAFVALVLPMPARAVLVNGDVIMDQRMSGNLCALTFDDGPSRYTPDLLDMLDFYGIPATFFLLGNQALQRPELVRRMVESGHEVGNHTFSHQNLRVLPHGRKQDEIGRAYAILKELDATPKFLRPPYGSLDPAVVDIAEKLGMTTILWSMDSHDWKQLPADHAKVYSTRGTIYADGTLRGIFLFHDTHKSTVDDLPRIVRQLKAGGCTKFVTVSEYLDGILDPEPAVLMSRHSQRKPAVAQIQQTQQTPVPTDGMAQADAGNPGQDSGLPATEAATRAGQKPVPANQSVADAGKASRLPASRLAVPLARCSQPFGLTASHKRGRAPALRFAPHS